VGGILFFFSAIYLNLGLDPNEVKGNEYKILFVGDVKKSYMILQK
jgi:hypothetical protein